MKNINKNCEDELDILKQIIEESPFSIQTFSSDGLCLTCNKAWEKLWRGRREEAVLKYNLLTDPQLAQRHISHLYQKAFNGEDVFISSVPYISPETKGTLVGKPLQDFLTQNKLRRNYVDVWMYPVKDEDGKVIKGIGVHQDVTDRKFKETLNIDHIEKLKAEIKKLKEQVKFNDFEIDKLKTIKGLK